jgi:hypothetical protein
MMAEWGIPFDHIEERWTDRQFLEMTDMLTERLKRQSGQKQGGGGGLVAQLRSMGVAR